MRISNQTPTGSNEIASSTTRADGAHANSAASSSATSPSAELGMMPSVELLGLKGQLSQIPATRSDAIASAVRRLASGGIHTPSAMRQTASAILGE